MQKIILSFLLLGVATKFSAQSYSDTLHLARLYHEEINRVNNIYSSTKNPVALSFNRVRTLTKSVGRWLWQQGDYHAIDQGKRMRDGVLEIGGMQHFGQLDVKGRFAYHNEKDYGRHWNSTLFLDPLNPFILADDVKSDMQTEVFDMSTTASYRFKRNTIALQFSYLTGNLSDQTDPRPKTQAMHFTIQPGWETQLSKNQRIGVNLGVDIFRSDMSHAVIDNSCNYTYYLMKGMGDYYQRTSADFAAYPRDYKGLRWNGAFQWVVHNSDMSNVIELSAEGNEEKAIDGGSFFTFKGGDYHRNDYGFSEQFRFNRASWYHDLRFTTRYITDQGDWYDQKLCVDPEHGNISYYEVLNKSKVRQTQHIDLHMVYRADQYRDGYPTLGLMAMVGLQTTEAKQYTERLSKQAYHMMDMQFKTEKYWHIGICRLKGGAIFNYSLPFSEKYACAYVDMAEQYVSPKFEYATASHYGYALEADASFPVKMYNYATWLGVNLRFGQQYYAGTNRYANNYRSSSRTFLDAALILNL